MGSSNQAKEALREKEGLLQMHYGNLLGKKFRNYIVEVTNLRKTTIEAFSAGKSNFGSSRREPLPDPRSVNISRGGELWGIRFSSPEAPTIKTTNKDGSNKTSIRIGEEDTNTQAKKDEDMVRSNQNPHLRIASDAALALKEELKLVYPIVK